MGTKPYHLAFYIHANIETGAKYVKAWVGVVFAGFWLEWIVAGGMK